MLIPFAIKAFPDKLCKLALFNKNNHMLVCNNLELCGLRIETSNNGQLLNISF